MPFVTDNHFVLHIFSPILSKILSKKKNIKKQPFTKLSKEVSLQFLLSSFFHRKFYPEELKNSVAEATGLALADGIAGMGPWHLDIGEGMM